MRNSQALSLPDYDQQVVFQAALAEHLMSFTEFAFTVVRPGITFKPNWHIDAITEKLSQVARGDVRRLIITLPPRTLKSLCTSVALPAWFLGHYPWERVVVISYSDFLARTQRGEKSLPLDHGKLFGIVQSRKMRAQIFGKNYGSGKNGTCEASPARFIAAGFG